MQKVENSIEIPEDVQSTTSETVTVETTTEDKNGYETIRDLPPIINSNKNEETTLRHPLRLKQIETVPKAKRIRKYQSYFLQYGFSFITENNVQMPVCLLCKKNGCKKFIFANSFLQNNKIHKHFTEQHKEYINKPLLFFVGISIEEDHSFLETVRSKIKVEDETSPQSDDELALPLIQNSRKKPCVASTKDLLKPKRTNSISVDKKQTKKQVSIETCKGVVETILKELLERVNEVVTANELKAEDIVN